MELRERSIREQRYAHLNGIKIHNQWRKIMRMAKVGDVWKCFKSWDAFETVLHMAIKICNQWRKIMRMA